MHRKTIAVILQEQHCWRWDHSHRGIDEECEQSGGESKSAGVAKLLGGDPSSHHSSLPTELKMMKLAAMLAVLPLCAAVNTQSSAYENGE